MKIMDLDGFIGWMRIQHVNAQKGHIRIAFMELSFVRVLVVESGPLAQFPSRLSYCCFTLMKTILSLSPAAQLETECLVAVVLDGAENAKGKKAPTKCTECHQKANA